MTALLRQPAGFESFGARCERLSPDDLPLLEVQTIATCWETGTPLLVPCPEIRSTATTRSPRSIRSSISGK